MSTPAKVQDSDIVGELRCYLNEDRLPQLSEPIGFVRGQLRANYGVSAYDEEPPTGVIILEDGELHVTPHKGESYFVCAPLPPHLEDAVARVRIIVSLGSICPNVIPGCYGGVYAPATAKVKPFGPQGTAFTVTGEGRQGLQAALSLFNEIINGPGSAM